MDILISAAPFEVEPFLSVLGEKGIPRPLNLSCGIGALNAAEMASLLAQKSLGKRVVFVGTAGVFGSFEQPSAYRVDRVAWVPTSDRLGASYSIKDSNPEIEIAGMASSAVSSMPGAWCLCGPSISLTADTNGQVEELVEAGFTALENLELYSIARRVAHTCRNFDCILVSTNEVGGSSHQQWRENFGRAAKLTEKILMELYFPN